MMDVLIVDCYPKMLELCYYYLFVNKSFDEEMLISVKVIFS